MEINDFLKAFKDQYADTNEIELTLDMNFRSINSYDSLTGMSILVMIQDEFHLNLSDEEFKSLNSVREVYEYIQNINNNGIH